MVLYNITVNVQHDVEEEWITWMQAHHIPDVMGTGFFKEYRFYRLLLEDQSGGTNYSLQFFAEEMKDINQYLEVHAPALRASHENRFKNKQASFRSLLEEVK